MDYLQYKGLKGTIEYSEEETVKALEEDFHEAVDGYLDICQKQGRMTVPAEDDEIGVSLSFSLYEKAFQYAEISMEKLMDTALRAYLEER